jgi:HEAT repeat protein
MFRHNDQALAVLSRFANHADPPKRRAAIYGLALSFHPSAEPLLVQALKDPDPETRYHAAWGLANFGSPRALPPLRAQLANEKEPQVRQEITAALTNWGALPAPSSGTQRSSEAASPRRR